MRRLSFGSPHDPKDTAWCIAALKKIEGATIEDVESVIDDLTIDGDFTPTRTLTPGTATTADLAAFIATMVSDIQKRGQNRTGG